MIKQDFNNDWIFYNVESESKQTIDLPHDAMRFESRKADNPSGSAGAFFGGGIYVYEKKFFAPLEWKEKTISIEFEGVYKDSSISLNGKLISKHAYGYTPFVVCLDETLEFGVENILKVVVDNKDMPNCRWYTGSGIYRPVWLHIKNKAHIAYEGVRISTLSIVPPKINVQTKHNGEEVSVEILDGDTVVAYGQGDNVDIAIENAKLWSEFSPTLYKCRVTLKKNNEIADQIIENFGIREIKWSPKGLFINGQKTLLRGGCVHHDNGILGATCFEKAEKRRAKIIKQAGFNAIRSSHNPISKSFLKACDEIGLYVIDETWDIWYSHKSKFDYATDFMENYRDDIKSMVSRDYNNPSVIMFSIGNEVSEPSQDKGVELAKEMVDLVHSLDKTRAVTCGLNLMIINSAKKKSAIYNEDGGLNSNSKKSLPTNSKMFNMITTMVGSGMNKSANSNEADLATSPTLDLLDIAGYNYASGRYAKEGKLHPNRVIYGSETFPQDIYKNWKMVEKYPYLVGDFMWTAWDYLGEVGLGAWTYSSDGNAFDKPYPWLLSEAGAIDIIGTIGAEAMYASAVWGLSNNPFIAVQPIKYSELIPKKAVWRGTNAIASWSWKNCEGKKAVVEVYSNAKFVKLFLNDKLIGAKKVKERKAIFTTKYSAGKLTAASYDALSRETGRSELNSSKGQLKIKITSEDNKIKVGEIAYIPIEIVGENNIVECNNDLKIKINVENGELQGFGSANPRVEESFIDGEYTTYYGRALAVVKGIKKGKMTISAASGNAMKSFVTIEVE